MFFFFLGGNKVLNSFFWCPIKSPSPLVKKRRKKRGLFVDLQSKSLSLYKKKERKKRKSQVSFTVTDGVVLLSFHICWPNEHETRRRVVSQSITMVQSINPDTQFPVSCTIYRNQPLLR